MRISFPWTLASVTGAAVLSLAGCVSPLDVLGNETQVSTSASSNAPEDDRIEDKNPAYDPDRIVVDDFRGCEVQLNKSASVAELDLVPLDGDARYLRDKLFTSRGEAISGVDANTSEGFDFIPSMEVVNGKLKPFNDGLYAAIELGVQEGMPDAFASKRKLLLDLIAAIDARLPEATAAQAAHLDEARVFLAAALVAGGAKDVLSPDLATEAEAFAAEFLVDESVSRPIGFYTWSPELEAVFRQDRYLQTQVPPFENMFGTMAALAAVLAEEPELRAQYEQILALYAGLTNPYVSHTPADILPYVDGLSALDDLQTVRVAFESENPAVFCTPAIYAFLPASRSKDNEFFNEQWCVTGLPAGTDVMDAFIAGIRAGEVDLTPAADAGWYDYQMWALETLLLPERGPESQHLLLTADYKQKLIDTFRSILTQNRETHVKQIPGFGVGGSGPDETDIYPLYPVEPFPTFYLRTARGYRFLRVYLEGVLGAAFLGTAGRLYEDTTRAEPSLLAELDQNIALLYGLYALSADSVGLDRKAHLLADELAEIDLDAAVSAARAWLDTWRDDRDVLTDPRVIVPVTTDDGTGKGIYWAILGVEVVAAKAEYVKGFEPEVIPGNAFCDVTSVVPRHYLFLVERMEEIRFAGPPPTRDEFRSICNQHDNAEDIIKALESRQ